MTAILVSCDKGTFFVKFASHSCLFAALMIVRRQSHV